MSVYTRVMLNDIIEAETDIITLRIKDALNKGKHGKNFWEHFFHCDEEDTCTENKNYVITHLFTKQQLRVLREWWDFNISDDNKDKVLKNNLDKSMKFFENNEHMEQIKEKHKAFVEPIYAFCITKFNPIKHPEVKRLIFRKSPAVKMPDHCIYFFDGNDFSEPPEELDPNKKMERFKGLVKNLRPQIVDFFSKEKIDVLEIKKEAAYFLYLGKDYYTHGWLKYCKDLNPNCSMVQAMVKT